ncbi:MULTISPECIES: histidine phosphatase family protein [unclassified Variovorax]|uniref:histidine phosphatase family protein n=1 Tax=unclassified Variovorax TaxID=663243 RepID=UPI0008CA76EB|nr:MULTISPECIES: histidine phosphatase family protein [unclassified Variovorax]SEK16721.1 probable phosphoglycerate mutase [Variovorax sp. OK202]SFE56396.1 probable phosphoglycerate mutase [Variovorax sp. OK212]
MKIVLVRHGRPDEDDSERPHDPPLRADGHAQAEAVAARLAQEGITRIVSSPMARAAQTAQPLARLLGLSVETIDGWAEADRHVARYRSTETLRALGEGEWRRFMADPIAYFGGDSASFRSAVLGALAATVEAGPANSSKAHVAVFTHGLPINVVLSHALGLERIVHFAPGYASMTRLRILHTAAEPHAIGVASVNERGHLPPTPPTPIH